MKTEPEGLLEALERLLERQRAADGSCNACAGRRSRPRRPSWPPGRPTGWSWPAATAVAPTSCGPWPRRSGAGVRAGRSCWRQPRRGQGGHRRGHRRRSPTPGSLVKRVAAWWAAEAAGSPRWRWPAAGTRRASTRRSTRPAGPSVPEPAGSPRAPGDERSVGVDLGTRRIGVAVQRRLGHHGLPLGGASSARETPPRPSAAIAEWSRARRPRGGGPAAVARRRATARPPGPSAPRRSGWPRTWPAAGSVETFDERLTTVMRPRRPGRRRGRGPGAPAGAVDSAAATVLLAGLARRPVERPGPPARRRPRRGTRAPPIPARAPTPGPGRRSDRAGGPARAHRRRAPPPAGAPAALAAPAGRWRVLLVVVAVVAWYEVEAHPSGRPGPGVIVHVARGE